MSILLRRSATAPRLLSRGLSTSLVARDSAPASAAAGTSSSSAPSPAAGAASNSKPRAQAKAERSSSAQAPRTPRASSSRSERPERTPRSDRGARGERPERSDRGARDSDRSSSRQLAPRTPASIEAPSTNWSSPLFATKGASFVPSGPPVAADVPLGGDGQPLRLGPLRRAERALHVHLRKGASSLGPLSAAAPSQALDVQRARSEEEVARMVAGKHERKAEAEVKKGEKQLATAAKVLEQNPALSPEGKQWVVKQMRELMK